MFAPFFKLAALSPSRQHSFRVTVVIHLGVLACVVWALYGPAPWSRLELLGHALLVAGIVEGAALVGWRLTQLPKSQALEFLLVSQMRPANVFVAEALVGLTLLALVMLSGLPVLLALTALGWLDATGVVLLLLMPWTWGAVTGLGLTVWAYEPQTVRRCGERCILALTLAYLAVGVLAGEHFKNWLAWLPGGLGPRVVAGFVGFHRHNPFAVLAAWLRQDSFGSWDWLVALEAGAALAIMVLLARAACRLQGHFHELHYQPIVDRQGSRRPAVGDHPLSWWAVKRVSAYAGRINLWLAGGFGLLYAVYVMAGPLWPAWLGRQVFVIFDAMGGIPVLAAGLIVLAAVPAAFQYGLWDSSVQNRCRRLELLLLTGLDGRDYWRAAASAAWRRGRGYFVVAVILWIAAVASGRATLLQATAALAAGVLLWALYFSLGFRAFARGAQANGLGSLLTLGLPLLAFALYRLGGPSAAALLPPGSVCTAITGTPSFAWVIGPALAAVVALTVARTALAQCDRSLRRWYDLNHGSKLMT